mmetsp:Transcript_771/g.1689  ORF Transcript_771/g.1689 Transcript_771/m.1689 type:complete len:215 (+) Transcript_771:322-966(+)
MLPLAIVSDTILVGESSIAVGLRVVELPLVSLATARVSENAGAVGAALGPPPLVDLPIHEMHGAGAVLSAAPPGPGVPGPVGEGQRAPIVEEAVPPLAVVLKVPKRGELAVPMHEVPLPLPIITASIGPAPLARTMHLAEDPLALIDRAAEQVHRAMAMAHAARGLAHVVRLRWLSPATHPCHPWLAGHSTHQIAGGVVTPSRSNTTYKKKRNT